jgi:hypothetical protein
MRNQEQAYSVVKHLSLCANSDIQNSQVQRIYKSIVCFSVPLIYTNSPPLIFGYTSLEPLHILL